MRGAVLARMLFPLALAVLPGQAAPTRYSFFTSQGKEIACSVYEGREPIATVIVLSGVDPSDAALAASQAQFLADHGFRVLTANYQDVTAGAEPTPANYRRWAQVVDDIVAQVRAGGLPADRKIALVGQSMGAAVALMAGAQKSGVDAIVAWSGLVPNEFYSQVQKLPPLLIVHGAKDDEAPVVNARQLVRLCELKDFVCEAALYPDEGHAFAAKALNAAKERMLAFLRNSLWSSLPTRAE
jgi:dipeptidyl aminopeptidase/acylaminoacyl peptidase